MADGPIAPLRDNTPMFTISRVKTPDGRVEMEVKPTAAGLAMMERAAKFDDGPVANRPGAMMASHLVERLRAIIAERGDMPVAVRHDEVGYCSLEPDGIRVDAEGDDWGCPGLYVLLGYN